VPCKKGPTPECAEKEGEPKGALVCVHGVSQAEPAGGKPFPCLPSCRLSFVPDARGSIILAARGRGRRKGTMKKGPALSRYARR